MKKSDIALVASALKDAKPEADASEHAWSQWHDTLNKVAQALCRQTRNWDAKFFYEASGSSL
jgi:hypothetical protein